LWRDLNAMHFRHWLQHPGCFFLAPCRGCTTGRSHVAPAADAAGWRHPGPPGHLAQPCHWQPASATRCACSRTYCLLPGCPACCNNPPWCLPRLLRIVAIGPRLAAATDELIMQHHLAYMQVWQQHLACFPCWAMRCPTSSTSAHLLTGSSRCRERWAGAPVLVSGQHTCTVSVAAVGTLRYLPLLRAHALTCTW